jgi:hypothetical protein
MSDNLAKADACGASLVGVYQGEGEFCLIVRTDRKGKATCRVTGQQVGNEVMSVFLSQCADALFNGPTQVEKASG